MMLEGRARVLWSPLLMLVATLSVGGASEASGDEASEGDIVVLGPVTPIAIEKTLLELPLAPPAWEVGDPLPNMNPRRVTNPEALLRPPPVFTPQRDPLLELQLRAPKKADRTFTAPDVNVAGFQSSCCPPDTVGEVGTTQYIQMVNGSGAAGSHLQVHSKTTGAPLLAGPFALEGLAPVGTPCAGGDGDPIPLFDQLANRWVLTQFEVDSPTSKSICLYISSGADLITSLWQLYRFDTGSSLFDYPKFGVWPDAYYGAANEGTRPLFAFDRAAMLAGTGASVIVRTHSTLPGFAFQITPPVDLSGPTAPPAGSPGIFIRHRDDESHDISPNPANDRLQIYEFTADFATPANSTLTGPTDITISEFESDLCGLTAFNCFPQPGTAQTLDPLREPIMQRPVYRNFGTHQSLIGSFVTDVDGGAGDRGGIRWFELRRAAGVTTGGWSLFQEGTVSAADGLSRWMGSLAMDQQGNMALGYSTSGPNAGQFPSIRYTGRQVGDAAGTMPQVETEIIAGTASQTISERWGDYSGMTVDPVDDCTFWYTTEYGLAGNGGFPGTRIASFSFDSCTNPVSCPTNLDLDNQTLSGSQTLQGSSKATLGPSLIIDGTSIVVNAPTVVFLNGVEVGGTFTAGNTTSCL